MPSYRVRRQTRSSLLAHSRRLALADANLLAIRRLLSRSLALSHSSTTPGPPLSKSHPSPSLLAKLHLNVYNLYDTARALCKASADDVSPELRRYLSDGRTVAQSLAFKWLGVDAGENGGRDKAGDALAWLGVARTGLEDVRGKSAGMGMLKIGKGKKAGKERKGKIADELDSVAAFLSAYKKVNDTVRVVPSVSPVPVPDLISLLSLSCTSNRSPPPRRFCLPSRAASRRWRPRALSRRRRPSAHERTTALGRRQFLRLRQTLPG